MIVYLQITLAGQCEAETGVEGERSQQMIEKTDSGGDPDFAAVERQLHLDARFLGGAVQFERSAGS